jgi:ATP-dependent DNA helicase RecG
MPESQNTEWKTNWRDEYLKWIAGFANAQGGTIFIGVNDNGEVVGLSDYESLLEELPNKFRDQLGIIADIDLLVEDDEHYIRINVEPYQVPISLRGRYYYRSGSTKQELKGSALNEFLLRKTGKTWDDVIETGADISDLDKNSIEQFINDSQKSKRIDIETSIKTKTLLKKLRLLNEDGLKRAALILFGKDPGRFYTNLSVKIGAFGADSADLKYHEVIEGNIIQLKEQIPELLNQKFLTNPIDFQGMQRYERDEYPVAAVREMFMNALVHRNYIGAQTQISVYDNNIRIWNDGGLPRGITEEDLKRDHASKPRNPIIADVCFRAGYIDSWGRGTLTILNSCKEAGLPEPRMEEHQGGFRVVVYKDFLVREYLQKMDLKERQIEAVLYLKEHPEITNSKYQELFDVSRNTASRDLNELVEKQVLRSSDTKGAGSYYELRIAP